MKQYRQICIAGTGKLAEALLNRLHSNLELEIFLWGRKETSLNRLRTTYRLQLAEVEQVPKMPVLLCVSDNAIDDVGRQLNEIATCLLHFSGSCAINVLPESEGGSAVCWPIQTFGNPTAINWLEVPLITETRGDEATAFTEWLCTALGGPRISLSEAQRRSLHLAAIVVNNFTNHLMQVSKAYCERNNLPFEHLLPLIKQTVTQLNENEPQALQTGPARRNDWRVIEKHLNMLKNEPELSEIYRMFSEQITTRYASEK